MAHDFERTRAALGLVAALEAEEWHTACQFIVELAADLADGLIEVASVAGHFANQVAILREISVEEVLAEIGLGLAVQP